MNSVTKSLPKTQPPSVRSSLTLVEAIADFDFKRKSRPLLYPLLVQRSLSFWTGTNRMACHCLVWIMDKFEQTAAWCFTLEWFFHRYVLEVVTLDQSNRRRWARDVYSSRNWKSFRGAVYHRIRLRTEKVYSDRACTCSLYDKYARTVWQIVGQIVGQILGQIVANRGYVPFLTYSMFC